MPNHNVGMRKTALFFIVLAATVSLVSCEWIGNLFGSSEPDAPHLRVSDLLIYDDSGLEAGEVTTLMKVVLTDDLIAGSQAFPELRVLGTFGEDGGPENVRCLVVKLDRDRLVTITSDAEGTEYLLHMTDYGPDPNGAESPIIFRFRDYPETQELYGQMVRYDWENEEGVVLFNTSFVGDEYPLAANPAESQVLPRSWLGSFEELVDETIEFFARCSHHFMVGMGWRVAQKYEEYLASENLPEEDQPDEGYEEATDLIETYDDYESDPVFEDEEFVRQGTSGDRDYTAISFQHHGVEEDELNLPAFEEENRAYFSIVSGHSQLGIINTELADPVVFGLQTTAGRPLEGITVKISPKDSTAIWTGTTDAAGQVSYIWSASETTPVQRLEISVNHPTWRVSPLEAAAIIFDCEDERSFTGAYDTSTAPYNMYGSDYGAVAISFEDLRANDPPNFEEWAPTSHEFGGGITDIFAPGGGFYGYGVSVSGLDYVLPEAGIHQPLHNVLDWELFPYFYAENIFTYTPQKPFPQDGFPLPIHVVVNLGFTSLKTYHVSGEVFIECSLSPMYIWTEHPDLSPFVTYLVPDGLYKQSHRDTVTGTVMPHFEFTLSGGKLNGEYKEYSTNPDEAGTVVWSCPYVDNVAHGQFVGYHSDGSVAGYGPYDNGKRHGDWYYYNSLGVITAHEVWNQDVLVSSN